MIPSKHLLSFGVINFASTFVGIYAIERLGRRLCLLTGSVAMSICFNLLIDWYSTSLH